MEITVIGSGSSGNGYRVQEGAHALLVEAGIPLRQIQTALHFELSAVDGCLVSHSHGDHAKAVPDLLRAGVDCYMSAETAQEIGVDAHHRLHYLAPLASVRIGGFAVLPFPLEHDVPNYGYLIARGPSKAVYITDTYYVHYRFTGLTHILVECNHAADVLYANVRAGDVAESLGNRIRHTHMSLETVKGFLQANDLSRVEQIWLLHLSDHNADADRFRREVQAVTGKPVYVA